MTRRKGKKKIFAIMLFSIVSCATIPLALSQQDPIDAQPPGGDDSGEQPPSEPPVDPVPSPPYLDGYYDGPRQSMIDTGIHPIELDGIEDAHEKERPAFTYVPAVTGPGIASTEPFYYSHSKVTRRIGLAMYEDRTVVRFPPLPPREELLVLECGTLDDFVQRPGFVNYEEWSMGTKTGYGNHQRHSPCQMARRLEYNWFKGFIHGANYWFSRNEHGRVQCFSLDGESCLPHDAISNDLVSAVTGENLQSNEISRWAEAFPSQVGWANTKNLNNDLLLRIKADPVICSAADQRQTGHWCHDLSHPDEASRFHVIDTQIKAKTDNMIGSMDSWKEAEYLKIDEDIDYENRSYELGRDIWHNQNLYLLYDCDYYARGTDAYSTGMYWYYNCQQHKDAWLSAEAALDALDEERADLRNAADAEYSELRLSDLHKLHETISASNDDHYSVLLKLESRELEELHDRRELYLKSAADQETLYEQAWENYIEEEGESGILFKAENFPFLGREITNVVNFVENPTKANFRHVVLGALGPVGEVAEGVIEFEEGSFDTQRPDGFYEEMREILTGFVTDTNFLEGLEHAAEEILTNHGAELVTQLRQHGLLNNENPPANSHYLDDYDSVGQVLELSSPVVRYGTPYDPWLMTHDASDPWYAQDHVKFFKYKFKPSVSQWADYLDDPSNYDSSDTEAIMLASGARQFVNDVDKIFAHAFGKDYAEVIVDAPGSTAASRMEVVHGLYEVLTDPVYRDRRTPRWVDREIIGERPAAFLYGEDDSVILFNADIVDVNKDVGRYYFEELGHMLNWWRCYLFNVKISVCEVDGDEGAKFADAVLLDHTKDYRPTTSDALGKMHHGNPVDPDASTDLPSLAQLLHTLPEHTKQNADIVNFASGAIGKLEGFPSLFDINKLTILDGQVSFVARAEMSDVKEYFPALSEAVSIDFVFSLPTMARKGDIFQVAEEECENESQENCLVSTLFLDLSLRDVFDFSISSHYRWKIEDLPASDVFDLHGWIQRKHGVRLAFQKGPGDAVHKFAGKENAVYYKYFSFGPTPRVNAAPLIKTAMLWKKNNGQVSIQDTGPRTLELEFPGPSGKFSWKAQIMGGVAETLDLSVPLDDTLDAFLVGGVGDGIGLVGGCLMAIAAKAFIAPEFANQNNVPTCEVGSIFGDLVATLGETFNPGATITNNFSGFTLFPILGDFAFNSPKVNKINGKSIWSASLSLRGLVNWTFSQKTIAGPQEVESGSEPVVLP